jgi:hypothetical protein
MIESLPMYKCCNPDCNEMSHKMKKCEKCKKTRYCSKDCQKANWSDHRINCNTICDVD